MTQLLENILPIDFYTNLLSVIAETKLLEFYLEQFCQEVSSHFKAINLQLDFFAVQWFVCLFTFTNNTELTKAIWLRIVSQGHKALIISAVALLSIFQNELLQIEDFSKITHYQYHSIYNYKFNIILS
jgi:hypothetical protein